MRPQQLKQLLAAIEAISACAEAESLIPTLLAQARDFFRVEAAWCWLSSGADHFQLHDTAGVEPPVPPQLQHMRLLAGRERALARRLVRLGYRSTLVAPLQIRARVIGMVAIGSRLPKRLTRIDADVYRFMVHHTCLLLDRKPRPPRSDPAAAPGPYDVLNPDMAQREHLYLLNTLISRITHGLNNIMATINGRIELLLNRPHNQSTMQHLGATLRAIVEASRLVRHIQALVSANEAHEAVMIDLNQMVRDSLQIARATWFLEFRDTRAPIELAADLRPLPALPAKAPDLRIAFLCLLRHAMDTLSPGNRLIIRTWTEHAATGEAVFISLVDDVGGSPHETQAVAFSEEEGIGILRSHAQTTHSQRALEFAETIVYQLGGRITVTQHAAGGATTLSFRLGDTTSYAR
jgi:K+-sensing histidine kinase KdpD